LQKKSPNKVYNPIVPSGLIAHTEKGYFYIKGKKKFKFVSERAMLSWSLPIVETIESQLSSFMIAGTLGFRDGTLIKDISDGKIYLISDSKKRHVREPDVLEWISTKVIDGSQKEILIHEEGEPLDDN
jgi:hypothetical protein